MVDSGDAFPNLVNVEEENKLYFNVPVFEGAGPLLIHCATIGHWLLSKHLLHHGSYDWFSPKQGLSEDVSALVVWIASNQHDRAELDSVAAKRLPQDRR